MAAPSAAAATATAAGIGGGGGGGFEPWLAARLEALGLDRAVYGAYIAGLLREEEGDEERLEALRGVLAACLVRAGDRGGGPGQGPGPGPPHTHPGCGAQAGLRWGWAAGAGRARLWGRGVRPGAKREGWEGPGGVPGLWRFSAPSRGERRGGRWAQGDSDRTRGDSVELGRGRVRVVLGTGPHPEVAPVGCGHSRSSGVWTRV